MTRAVLLDSFGTLVQMAPPGPRLRAELARDGFEVTEELAAAAFRAEIGYYLEHHVEGHDPRALDALRDRCAERLREALALPGLGHARAREAMLASLRFSGFRRRDSRAARPPRARPSPGRGEQLGLLAARGGWADAGWAPLVDAVVSSATAGAVKPDPRLFDAALEAAGCGPEEALHVGDSPEHDLAGARAAGVRAVLIDRAGGAGADGAIRSLRELPSQSKPEWPVTPMRSGRRARRPPTGPSCPRAPTRRRAGPPGTRRPASARPHARSSC